MKTVKTTSKHEACYQDLCKLVDKHAGTLSRPEMLAIAANMVGKLIALQDQRTMTKEAAMEMVAHNIEVGNAHAISRLEKTGGTRQ